MGTDRRSNPLMSPTVLHLGGSFTRGGAESNETIPTLLTPSALLPRMLTTPVRAAVATEPYFRELNVPPENRITFVSSLLLCPLKYQQFTQL